MQGSKCSFLILSVSIFVPKIVSACVKELTKETSGSVLISKGIDLRPVDSQNSLGTDKVDGFLPSPYIYSSDNGFIVGGENSSQAISKMATLTGVNMDLLTQRALGAGATASPFADYSNTPFAGMEAPYVRQSADGFIRDDQTLREVLVASNNLVLNELKTTHQQLASPILTGLKALEDSQGSIVDFEYNGNRYRIEASQMGGSYQLFSPKAAQNWRPMSGWKPEGVSADKYTQGSFLNDNLYANYIWTIKNLDSGETLKGDALTPHLAYRYGFWQSGPYDLDPRSVNNFFRRP